MTPAKLLEVAPEAHKYAEHLISGATRVGIAAPLHWCHFLAQCAVESGGFEAVRESLNYKVGALVPTFGKHRISDEQDHAWGRLEHRGPDGKRIIDRAANQQAIANQVYGGEYGRKALGNTDPGDGWLYIGRGLIQVTGKENYRRYLLDAYGSAEQINHPELLEEPKDAAWSACYFWKRNNLNQWALRDDGKAVSGIVNAGSPTKVAKHLEERLQWLERAKKVLL